MENIEKMGLSYGLFRGREGGEVFGEGSLAGKHTTTSLRRGCKVGCHRGIVEKAGVGCKARFGVACTEVLPAPKVNE